MDETRLKLVKTMSVGEKIESVAVEISGKRAAAATENEVLVFDFAGSSLPSFKKKQAEECCECGANIRKTQKKSPVAQDKIRICPSCHRFFCNKCLSQQTLTLKEACLLYGKYCNISKFLC